jgi:hypothetical protein
MYCHGFNLINSFVASIERAIFLYETNGFYSIGTLKWHWIKKKKINLDANEKFGRERGESFVRT